MTSQDTATSIGVWDNCESAAKRFPGLSGAILQKQIRRTYIKPARIAVNLFGPDKELLVVRHEYNNRKHKTTVLHYSRMLCEKGWFQGCRSEIILMRVPLLIA